LHSSEYDSFTNEAIQTFIASMRQKFDSKYRPQSILMSTGHTIAYASVFKLKSTHQTESQYITFSQKVLCASLNGNACLLWWNRNRGCSYIIGKWAVTLHNALVNGISSDDFLKMNLPQAIIETLWLDSCLCKSEHGIITELKINIPAEMLEITQSNRLNSLSWYGQYDAS